MGDASGAQVSPRGINGLLAGTDLRGLSPKEIAVLMGGAINTREIQSRETEAVLRNILGQQHLTAQEKQNAIENYYRGIKTNLDISAESRLQQAQQFDQSKLTPSAVFTADGNVSRQWHDAIGNVVRTDVLGKAPEKLQNAKLLELDGQAFWANPGEPIPAGAKYLASKDNGFSINDQAMLAGMKGIVESGEDTKGQEYSEVDRDNYMTMVNLNDPDTQYVKIPGQEVSMGRDIPPQYVKLPKNLQTLKSLPDSAIMGVDSRTGQAVTLGQMKDVAQKTNNPIEAVFKYFNIQYK